MNIGNKNYSHKSKTSATYSVNMDKTSLGTDRNNFCTPGAMSEVCCQYFWSAKEEVVDFGGTEGHDSKGKPSLQALKG